MPSELLFFARFVFVLALTPTSSESCFDESFQDSFFFTPTQAVNIAKWSEDVSGAANTGSDLICSSPVLDMNGADAFELKHETASVYSMDSAYQSQSDASRRGVTMPEGYQTLTPQETRSRVSSQFLGSDIYSPTLSSGNFTAFPEQHSDISQMQLPSAAGDMETGEHSFAYANYTTGQDYSQYTATSIPRFAPVSAIDMGFPWSTTDTQNFNTQFNFASYPKSSHSIETSMYSSHDTSEIMFNAPAPPQRQLSKPRLDTSVRPSIVRNSSAYSVSQLSSRRSSTNDSNFGAFVMSPTSGINAQASAAPGDFEQQLLDTR